MRVTNTMDISLPLAVWLLHDDYDYIDEPNYISATSLMKPLRQLILPRRVPKQLQVTDVSEFIARTLGSSIHSGIEKAWSHGNHRRSMQLLGYPEEMINRVVVNPTADDLRTRNDIIPIYVEQRAFKQIEVGGVTYTIGGKFDMIGDGQLNDFKSTSVWSWVKGTKDEDYARQGSLYRWLNPDKVFEDHIRINFIFTDWSKAQVSTVQGYPTKRVEYKDIELYSMAETERWIRDKLALLQKYQDTPETDLPECSDEELWRSAPQYRYFSDPAKAQQPDARATRNFDNPIDARKFQAEKGGKGVIVTKLGEPKACGYCAGFEACTQRLKF